MSCHSASNPAPLTCPAQTSEWLRIFAQSERVTTSVSKPINKGAHGPGDLILDNKKNAVLPWQQTGYVYVKGEGVDGAVWVWFADQVAPTATAAK
jgi:hypothetical protein